MSEFDNSEGAGGSEAEEKYTDYTYRAARKNRSDIVLSVVMYVSAVVAYGFSMIDGIGSAGILQYLALVLIVAAVFVNYRYTWQTYAYRIKPLESRNTGDFIGYSFIVYKITGKKSVMAANIPCRDCIKIVECTHKSKRPAALATYEKPMRYFFTKNLMPAVYYTAVFRADGGIVFIAFEPDDEFLSYLREYMNKKGSE